MAQGLTQVKASIRQIDRNIDGVRKELMQRAGTFNTLSAMHWQIAWDRFPELCDAEKVLFCQRGELQRERNLLEDQAYRAKLLSDKHKARKAVKASVCKSCGQALAA